MTSLTDIENVVEVEENRIGYSVSNLGKCQYATSSAFFDLKNIVSNSNTDKQIESNVLIPNANDLSFNFCETPIFTGQKCFASFSNDKKCTESKSKPNTFGKEILDDNGNVNGIDLYYILGDVKCPSDQTKQLSLNIEVHCDKNQLQLVSHPNNTDCAVRL